MDRSGTDRPCRVNPTDSTWAARISGRRIRHVGVDVVGADIEIRCNLAFDGRRASVLFGHRQIILGLRSHGVRFGLLARRGELTGLGLITMFLSLATQLCRLLIRSALHQYSNQSN